MCAGLACRQGVPLAGADCASWRIGTLATLSNVDAARDAAPGAACWQLRDCGKPVAGRLSTLANLFGACCALGTGALFLSWILPACAAPASKQGLLILCRKAKGLHVNSPLISACAHEQGCSSNALQVRVLPCKGRPHGIPLQLYMRQAKAGVCAAVPALLSRPTVFAEMARMQAECAGAVMWGRAHRRERCR